MARHLFIVSRAHGLLYEYLIERFADDPNVEVILDRRVGERRQSNQARREDRRRGDRRAQVRLDDDIGHRSHRIVTLES
jgi:hypothetical protein